MWKLRRISLWLPPPPLFVQLVPLNTLPIYKLRINYYWWYRKITKHLFSLSLTLLLSSLFAHELIDEIRNYENLINNSICAKSIGNHHRNTAMHFPCNIPNCLFHIAFWINNLFNKWKFKYLSDEIKWEISNGLFLLYFMLCLCWNSETLWNRHFSVCRIECIDAQPVCLHDNNHNFNRCVIIPKYFDAIFRMKFHIFLLYNIICLKWHFKIKVRRDKVNPLIAKI